MKKGILYILFLLIAVSTITAQPGIYYSRKSIVNFTSDAPLELIKAASTQLKGLLDLDKRSFSFSVPSTSFIGFNSPLQQIHFYENYIEAQKYPDSKFQGKIIEQLDFSNDGDYIVRAKGALTIHGVEQERIIKVKITMNKGVMYATADFSVLLQDHNITVPKVVYQKIAEEIFVHVSLELVKK